MPFEPVAPLAGCSLLHTILLPLVPILTVVLVMTVGIAAHQGSDPGWPDWVLLVPLGAAYVAVVTGLYWRWDRSTWRAAAVVRSPAPRELGVAVVATAVGIAIVIVGNVAATTVGLDPHARAPVTSTAGITALVLTSIVIAPVAEEILFRGLVLGHFLARGYGVVTASLLSIALFAFVHVFMAGAVSIAVTGALGVVLTALRLWYDSLVAPWVMHLLVNAWGLTLTIGLMPIPW
ncbi:type II CAAX endopeptidase family protein [Natronococcus sp. A-GB7]|uniref:CPBP family intramembrane glutamic endopeptidase n=1 Tax=Natronococcus sp. A-GB7 TaxID=3037649 RepID=UPI00241CC0D9|nr:type II CAAX endopeptidase family protein [Natronococcus sp. A-GB7]MDG5821196.1 type II CAAX endopeptidase family protein [Natronococcus sp. A-GB7]